MITIKFTDDVEVRDHNGDVEFEAKAGDVKSLVAPSARFWLTRDKAVVVTEAPKDEAEAPAEKKPAPKKKRAAKKQATT